MFAKHSQFVGRQDESISNPNAELTICTITQT